MIDINQDCKTGSKLIKGVIHLLVQSHTYLLEFTSVKYVICQINTGSKNFSILLNHSMECSQYFHRTAGRHCAISLSCFGGGTWLPRPLFLSLVSGQHNSNNSIAMKLPVKVFFLEIAIAIMVLNHSVFIWGDSPWFELGHYAAWVMDWFPAGAGDFSVLFNVCRVTVVLILDAHGKAADPCSWWLIVI